MGERPSVVPVSEVLTFDKVNCTVERASSTHPPFLFQGLFLSIRAVQTLRRLQSSRTIVIGIAGYNIAAHICSATSSCFRYVTSLAGPSGSGKSHFAKELVNFLPGSTIIGMDNYMQREKARLFTNFL
jgi:hypothetical protein